MLVAVAPHGQVQPLRQRVDHGHADAVQAAGHLVAAALAELAAGVQDGQHDLGRGPLLLLHRVDGDAAPVVGDRHRVVRVDHDLDLVGLAGERLVDSVVDNLVDQVMEAAGAGRADVHARTLADGLEPFEDGDVLRVVAAVALLLALAPLLGGPPRRSPPCLPCRPFRRKTPVPWLLTHGPGCYIRPPSIVAA